MSWDDYPDARHSVALLRRSLERGRVGHAYLFSGEDPELLEAVARELAATLNCTHAPGFSPAGLPVAACGRCSSCRRIHSGLHPDIHWLRAESKMRVIRVEQVRDLMHAVQLKPAEARRKVAILAGADCLNAQAANAFLKTLEEPPAGSLLILLSTEPGRLLETLLSRCLRLAFPSPSARCRQEAEWIQEFARHLQQPPRSLLARYRLLAILLRRLADLRRAAEETVASRSPARQHEEVEAGLAEQWENEAKAAAEGEYRRRRGEAMQALQAWWRDVWMITLGQTPDLLELPDLEPATRAVAARLDPGRAEANLQLLEEAQSHLHTNVQEALALEVALLRLHC